MLYQSCCPLTVVTSHQVGAHTSARSPGDMTLSPDVQMQLLPGPGVWAPLQAGVTGTGVPSAAQEPRVLKGVVPSHIR